MLLKEFIYFDKKNLNAQEDNRYLPDNDSSILSRKDVRKTRLTLRMLNQIRLMNDQREQETNEELVLIRKMYAAPPPQAGGI
jgi:hypothetical protein